MTELDDAFDTFYEKQRKLRQRVAYAYSAIFGLAAVAYAFGDVPLFALPCAWVSGYIFRYLGET